MDKDEWSKVKEFVKINIGESAHTNWIQPIELKEIKGTVAKFKVPKSVEFVDALPRNATGKVLKRNLREDLVGTDAPAIS